MYEILISLCTVVMTPLLTYFVAKKVANDTINNVKDEVFDYLQTENGAKMLFGIGAMLGNGIKSGVGLQKGTGKFKWQDIIGQIASQFIMQKFQPQQQPEQQQQGF